jgi:glycosyltransferase involved in cell wall biosynthesis/tRNA A-37 threonylcarbamoyl transferase component Bud32
VTTATFEAQSPAITEVEETALPAVRTTIAVLVTRFPVVDEAYILREIVELERQGQPVLLVPLLRGRGKVVHEEAKPWVRRALYIPLLSPSIVVSNLRAMFQHPARYLKVLLLLFCGTMIRPRTLIRTLALFPKSVHLASVLPKRGINHLHSHFSTHATTMAYIISRFSKITYSFTIHGPDVFVHRLLLLEKISRATAVRTISAFNKAFLCGLYPSIPEEKIHVVHIGVNPEVYETASSESERTTTRPQVLSVGAITPSRGFGFLIEAGLMLKNGGIDVEMTIVGNGPRRRFLQHWTEYLGLADDVHLPGSLAQHEVARRMGETDVFVLPSVIANDGQMDGIPITLMEAMAAGKPVIASAMSGIPELIDDRVSGLLIDATHPQRIANAIRFLIANPAVRHKMGRAGQRRIREEFDIRKTVASLIEFLDAREDTVPPIADRLLSFDWGHLKAAAFGVREVYERRDSYVAEVAISDGGGKREVVVKQQRARAAESRKATERARTEFRALTMLRGRMGQELTESGRAVVYSVPKVLAFDESTAALILERARGKSLETIIRDARMGLRNPHFTALHRAGIWLAKMQSYTPVADDGRHILTAVVVLALRDLELAAVADRMLRPYRAEIAERLRALESRLADKAFQVVGRHGDYWPGNIFIDDDRVEVIDFEGYREGLPLEDVAQFLVHLELYLGYPLLSNMRRRLRAAFLDSYVAFGGQIDDDALQLFTLGTALQFLARVRRPTRGVIRDWWRRRVLRKVIRRNLA